MAFGFSLGEKLGWQGNPLYDALSSRRNALMGLGAGIATGTDWQSGISEGLQLAANGAKTDDAYALLQEEKAAEQETLNKTTEWLRQNGHANLLAAVESGAMTPGDAWAQALAPASSGPSPIEINGQLVDPNTGQVIGDYRDPQTGPNLSGLPSDYQTYLLAKDDPEFAAFQATQPGPMNSTVQNAILDADAVAASSENSIAALNRALELNQVAYDGPWAGARAQGSALFGDQGGQATLELQNIVTANALESLKATFGAAPTEGERKILLEIQGSVDQPKAVREAIFKRAIEAANRRIAMNQQKATGLRSGTYFTPGYGAQQPAANTTSNGLTWSIEP